MGLRRRKSGCPANTVAFRERKGSRRRERLTRGTIFAMVISEKQLWERGGPDMMHQEELLSVLKRGLLFRNMEDGEILEALEAIESHRRTYPKRALVMRDGDLMSQVGVILSGNLHLFHIDANGNSNLMEELGAGESIGLLNAIGGYRLHISAETTQETEILFLNVSQLLRNNVLTAPVQIRFLQNLTLAVAQQAHRLTRKLEDSIRRSTRERLQDYLSDQYHKAGSRTFSIPLNRQDLADFLFVDRSAMSNELCKMRDEGLLKFDKSKFELLIEMPITQEEPDPNQ
ncbi:Crp/Fnr family transcriptional regulator [Pseudoflavonifractor sp. AF19-9AC]|nr:Crp/Fnr family transcriptional regulator [Pseudoflavonifractor sp. AF19-9AC]